MSLSEELEVFLIGQLKARVVEDGDGGEEDYGAQAEDPDQLGPQNHDGQSLLEELGAQLEQGHAAGADKLAQPVMEQ